MRGSAIVAALFALVLHAPASGQEARPIRAFASAGLGFGSHETVHASLSVSHDTGDYLLRGAIAFETTWDPFGGGGLGWSRELSEVALLYGRRGGWGWGWGRAALGVGYVDTTQLDPVTPGETPDTNAFGLAMQAGLVWTPQDAFGLGLTGVGNFNDLRSLAALTLSVHVGRVR